jgi:hypothetical protein
VNGIGDDSTNLNVIRCYHNIDKGWVICFQNNALILGDNAPHIEIPVVDDNHSAVIQRDQGTIDNQNIALVKRWLHRESAVLDKIRCSGMNNQII